MNKSFRFTDENFSREVLDSELPVLVDFWGSWCPPCKMVEPVVNELANEFAGKVKVGKLNIDQNPATRSKFEITAAPTFILFEKGKILERVIGSRSKKQLTQMFENSLASLKAKRLDRVRAITSTGPEKQQPTDVLEKV